MGTDAAHAVAGVQEFASTQGGASVQDDSGERGAAAEFGLGFDQNPATKSHATMEAPKLSS